MLIVGLLGAVAGQTCCLTLLLLSIIEAGHPPAGATALLVSLGIAQQPMQALYLMIGAICLGIIGELMRRTRLIKPPFRPSEEKMKQKLEP